MRLANKAKDAAEAAGLLAEKSIAVKELIESRKPKKRPPPPPAPAVHDGDGSSQQQSAKKMKPTDSTGTPAPAAEVDPQSYVGRRVAKYFDVVLYYGSVREYTPPDLNDESVDLWNILYDDGDNEDLERKELDECFDLYRRNETGDPEKNS